MGSSTQFPLPFPEGSKPENEPEFVGCEAAEDFYGWAKEHLANLDYEDPVAINQEMIQVTLKYHEWYNQVPERHRVRVGKRGHECIFHVFMMALDALVEARTRLDPPVYFPPPPPEPPRVRPVAPGVYLAEVVEEE